MTLTDIETSRLLLVDDDPDLRTVVLLKFSSAGFQIDQAENVAIAKIMLYEKSYDLIILDLMMVPESGYVLFDFLKNEPKFKWTPLIVLSGQEDIDEKVKCLQLGADDYVTKPFKFKELKARVCRLLTRTKEFEQMAFLDTLTNIYNRRYFENHLMIEMHKKLRSYQPKSIAMLDIDKFKNINDTFGHTIGDIVLKGIAEFLVKHLRESDVVARFGGEEFIIFFDNTSDKTAAAIMETLLDKVQQHCLAHVDDLPICVTFSAGVAAWRKGLSQTEWIDHADQALYHAKQSGRNRCVRWIPFNGGA